ncbi:hypothetical protein [Clostridium beijerinckii]|uniref:Acyl carrier protein n=1 Tax=Clostridium beijerinckii TaxID=1520 RepID=A0AAE5H461_CLOBE|nr:hypothetical protein [Clostridium beijerinckii]ALB45652.1 acyl carrier protein [Clostridium beijerinckii NRRL B-598]NRT86799.1 acyl carrier protein [Clostridium beijerinckii]NSB14165.1 acyl carrier protein [Clostridium beijerinckii]NYC72231.1 acyl carrier protein [Clostridium beijerinckii]OOM30517.1 hypothetical protein CLOBE_16310 [Clostridium beijerinckii]
MNNYERVKSFLEERFLIEFGGDINDDTDLFKAGVIESKGYMNIIKFIKSDLGIEMTDDDIFLNVFTSLSNIMDFVNLKINN